MNTTSGETLEDNSSLNKPPLRSDSENSVNYLASFSLIQPFLIKQKWALITSIFMATLSVAFELFPIYAIYRLLVLAIEYTINPTTVMILSVSSLISVLAAYILLGLAMRTSHFLAFNSLYQLRIKIAKHLALLPMGFYSKKKSGDAKKLLIDDPEQLELIIAHGIPEGISAIATWFAVSCWLFYIDWRMALASILITPISFYLLIKGMKKGSEHASAYQRANQVMNASVVEYLNGLPIIKIFNQDEKSHKETEQAIKNYANTEKSWAQAYLPYGGTFFSLVLSNVIFIVILGSFLVVNHSIDVITFVFFIIVGANYSRPLLKLFHLFHQLAHISMNSQLTEKVLATPPQTDSHKTISLDNYTVEFDNVSFRYDQQEVLHNISFTAKPNEITALVGPSGAGKSTLATLIPRFYDISKGQISIGGHSITEFSIEQLMDTVSFVFQDTFLFTGTLEENIKFGSPQASVQDMILAAQAAQIHDLILSLPEGYQTKVGDKGRKLSGGECQRIAIARAILKNSPIIILDEATAFSDPENEALIQQAIEALTKDKTVIVIAHRLNTIKNVDQIVVIDNGFVVEKGLHENLLSNDGVYKKLWTDFCAIQTSESKVEEYPHE
ncbi:ABC transporter ATP-binding protein [Vibrio salinus]|uniref:ABC transporter ATP-binding protein n=1 Tax=Vibrio salinus TaxID=2899784 RepID=UPI001E3ED3EC|nr:ABC transporter ATP-binding protein [Vibrio salinus]MCE0495708.1 ABC transporter ATP-binding protein/permease [Vibrio salinus]